MQISNFRCNPQLIAGLLIAGLGLGISASATADGVAVFASISDPQSIGSARAQINDVVGTAVETSNINIKGVTWTRLHSPTLPESEARRLVANARQHGYSAWFNGSGDSLASSSSATAVSYTGRTDTPVEFAKFETTGSTFSDRGADIGVVRPANGDISHLPLAETFPLEGR